MAAYAALVSVMQILDQIQVSSPPPISIDKTLLQSLTQKLAFLQQFLESYSSHAGYTEEADPMASRIADAAYAAEDVIESHIVDQILARSTNRDAEISSIKFYQSLQTVIDQMELIEVEAMEIKQKKGARDQLHTIKSATDAGSVRSASIAQNVTMVGFDDVLHQMLDKITGGGHNRQIIPIVGMGGIGKTTLARNIYDNRLVHEHFDVCAWSTISQEHKSRKILEQVLGQVNKGGRGDLSEYELGDQLYKCLKSERTRGNWEPIGENLNSIVNTEDNESCLQILYLSYNSLPIHLKPCFLYMAMFMDDVKIDVILLVVFWVVEGFLKPLHGKSLEEAVEEYLEELVDRNLILVEKRNYCGKLELIKIHDLLRDLCLREARKVKFLCVLEEQSIPQNLNTQRRIKSRLSEYSTQVLQSLENASLVRSMCGIFPMTLLSNFRMLRTPLLMGNSSGEDCEEVFLGLVNLRLIVVGDDPFLCKIPSSIYFFWNLQTLILSNECKCILEIWKLPQLRHALADGDARMCLPYPPDGDVVVLRNLHTLSTVTNLICGEEVVCRIPNIKELKLYYDDVESMETSPGLNNLRHLHKLETLAVDLTRSCDSRLVHNMSFPHSLKWLELENTELEWEDMNTRIGPLPLLQVLELHQNSFTGSEWETLEGQFRSLKFLQIEYCDLEQWVTNNSHFPLLEHLVLRSMYELTEIPSSMGDIPTL